MTQRHLPDAIYVGQVSSLYADRASFVMGLVNTGICGIITIFATGAPAIAALVVLMLAIGAVRLFFFDRFERVRANLTIAAARQWQRGYTLGAACYLATLGCWTLAIFVLSDEKFPIAVALGATISTAFGIPMRNFAFKHGAQIQMAAVAAPLFATCAWLGGRYWLLALLVFAPTFLFMKKSATRLRDLLLDELVYRQKSEEAARHLDMAVNSMTLGLCMLSTDQRVLLANGRFRTLMGLSASSRLRGRPIDVLLRAVRARKMFPEEELLRLQRYIATARSDRPLEPMNVESVDRNFFEISMSRSISGNSVIIMQDITDRRLAERAVDRMAWFDMVTGLPNRRSFDRALQEMLTKKASEGGQAAVLLIDIDDFKQVNDTLGHRRGDSFLIEIGSRLLAVCGPDHLAARWGGDEFVILTDRVDAMGDLADRIVAALALPCQLDGYEVACGASIGIATTRDVHTTADDLLQHADLALYAAKSSGRNRWTLYTKALNEAAKSKSELERDVRSALSARQFELFYQPIVDLKTGEIVSFEALARWRDAKRGMVPPNVFVPIIEELGLVVEFGEWVLQQACVECVNWPAHVRVGVNLSVLQIRNDPQLEQRVIAALGASGLSAKRLELEITETILLEASSSSMDMLQRLRALGVKIALDDFGTGYSSLSYLMSVPLDKVKIDRSFVAALGENGQAGILVDSVAKLGGQLGMVVTAEGIETRAQFEFLKALHHVREGQGYLFGKPMPAEDARRLFDSKPVRRTA